MMVSKDKCLETAVLLALVCMLMAWWSKDWVWVAFAALSLGLGLIVPVVFQPLAWLWFGLGKVLGLISSDALLVLVFFLLIVPVGLIRRWCGKDILQRGQFKKSKVSVFKVRNHTYAPSDLKNSF